METRSLKRKSDKNFDIHKIKEFNNKSKIKSIFNKLVEKIKFK